MHGFADGSLTARPLGGVDHAFPWLRRGFATTGALLNHEARIAQGISPTGRVLRPPRETQGGCARHRATRLGVRRHRPPVTSEAPWPARSPIPPVTRETSGWPRRRRTLAASAARRPLPQATATGR
jgi:hypothetical protein